MRGQMFAFSITGGGGYSNDIGDMNATQLYPSVCKLLGVEPSSDLADSEAIDFDPEQS